MTGQITHAELVIRAERWLRNTIRCGVVLTEAAGADGEIPDAIGWRNKESTLIECKASRSDFLADKRKIFRGNFYGIGMGQFRYYMAVPGVIAISDLPPKWGLLEVGTNRVRTLRKATRWDRGDVYVNSLRNEVDVLLGELRKIQILQGGGSLLQSKAAARLTRTLGRA